MELSFLVLPLLALVLIWLLDLDIVDSFSVSLSMFGILFIHSIWLLFSLNWFTSDFVFGTFTTFGLDLLSVIMLLLTSFIGMIIVLSMWKSVTSMIRISLSLMLFIFTLIYGAFLSLDIFVFYICFEFILIPLFIFIAINGSSKRKIQAVYELFIYTIFGSLFFLFGILLLYLEYGSTHLLLLSAFPLSYSRQLILFVAMFMSFAIKLPLFPFHIWLPKAHVEAPTSASVLLAAILLKFGSYAFIRFSLVLTPDAILFFRPVIFSCGLLGVIYGSFAALAQTDIKKVIAYSSVSHMNLSVIGLFSFTISGLVGSIYFIITHALVASAMFLLIGVLYDRYHSRIIFYFKGITLVMPLFSLFMFLFTLGNIAFPFTGSFISELLTSIGGFLVDPFIVLLYCIGLILTPLYSFWFFHMINLGSLSKFINTVFNDLTYKEFMIFLVFLITSYGLGIFPSVLLDYLYVYCAFIIL